MARKRMNVKSKTIHHLPRSSSDRAAGLSKEQRDRTGMRGHDAGIIGYGKTKTKLKTGKRKKK